jgi:hypothetical protein
MNTQSISIYAAVAAALALLAAMLWFVVSRRFRMASTSEELLDLLEESYSVREDQASLTLPNEEGPEQDGGGNARAADPGQLPLGAYEKARVERYLKEVNGSRMTFEQAQQAIAREWIATYEPIVRRERFNRDN